MTVSKLVCVHVHRNEGETKSLRIEGLLWLSSTKKQNFVFIKQLLCTSKPTPFVVLCSLSPNPENISLNIKSKQNQNQI